ncbi:hypothetical protein ACFL1Z_00370 [Thermodesulfobacteriota bacterium]
MDKGKSIYKKRSLILRYAKPIIKAVFTLLLLYYLFDVIYDNYYQIFQNKLTLNPFIIVFFLFLYLLWLLLFEYSWEFAFRRLFFINVKISAIDSAMAFARSFLYRYIPGKIWFLGARTEFLKKHDVPRSHVLNATIIEQLNFFITPIFFFSLAFPFLGVTLFPSFTLYTYCIIFFSSMIGLSLWLLLPFYFSKLIKKWGKKSQIKQDFFSDIKNKSSWLFFVALFFLLTIFQGVISIPIIANFLDGPEILNPLEWIYLIAAYPFARVIGQLGILTPSGLGVREGAYIFLVSPIIGVENSALVSMWFRFLAILAEAIFFLVIFFLSIKIRPKRSLQKD